MNNKQVIFHQVLKDINSGIVNIDNCYEQENFCNFLNLLFDDITKYSNSIYNGKFEKILFQELNNSIENQYTYEKFI